MLFSRSKIKEVVYKVMESDGVVGGIYPVEQVKGFNEGLVMLYRKGMTLERVYVGRGYIPLRINGCYWVGKKLGNNSAARIVEGEKIQDAKVVVGDSTDSDCPGEDLSGLVGSDILGIGIRAVRKKDTKLIWVIGIGLVVVAAIIFFAMRG